MKALSFGQKHLIYCKFNEINVFGLNINKMSFAHTHLSSHSEVVRFLFISICMRCVTKREELPINKSGLYLRIVESTSFTLHKKNVKKFRTANYSAFYV